MAKIFDISIALVGPMGAGKSTIGRLLAKTLDFDFVDLDEVIQIRTGVEIATIFDIEGEKGFRQRESCALADFVNKKKLIISTGGGVVISPENRELLKKVTHVIYLKATVEQIYQRVQYDKKRPLLAVEDPKAVLERLIAERQPWYEDVASYVLISENKPPKKVTLEIVNMVEQS